MTRGTVENHTDCQSLNPHGDYSFWGFEADVLPSLKEFTGLSHGQIITAVTNRGIPLGERALNQIFNPDYHSQMHSILETVLAHPDKFEDKQPVISIKGSAILTQVCQKTLPRSHPGHVFVPGLTKENGVPAFLETDLAIFSLEPKTTIPLILQIAGVTPDQEGIEEVFSRSSPWLKITRINHGSITTTEIYHFYEAVQREPWFAKFFPEFNLHADIAFSPCSILSTRVVLIPDFINKNWRLYLYDPLGGMIDLLCHNFRPNFPELVYNPERGSEAIITTAIYALKTMALIGGPNDNPMMNDLIALFEGQRQTPLIREKFGKKLDEAVRNLMHPSLASLPGALGPLSRKVESLLVAY